MTISIPGLKLIEHFEGLRLKAYKDSVGIWTIGYGHTAGVCEGDEITPEQAEAFLHNDVAWAERVIATKVPCRISQNQFDALVSLIYNIGSGNFAKSSVLRALNAGDMKAAAEGFLLWNKAGGKEIVGLTNRRRAEMLLFQGDNW